MYTDILRRIAGIEYRQKEAALEKAGLSASKRHATDSPPIEIKIPEGEKRSAYMQVMCDLNVLAFQTDTTRVSTYIGSTPNGVSYPELGFRNEHHSQTHHNNEAEKVRKVAAITAFNIAQFTLTATLTVLVLHAMVLAPSEIGPGIWTATFVAVGAGSLVGAGLVLAVISLG